jgi:hypothetical protein
MQFMHLCSEVFYILHSEIQIVPNISILKLFWDAFHTLYRMGSYQYSCLVIHYMQTSLEAEFDPTDYYVQLPNFLEDSLVLLDY